MELLEIFQVLGIERTKDEREIKNAYRTKLALTNPEDDSEGFKRLRSAYEQACAYARKPEEEEETKEQKDTTPSGLWVEKAGLIYGNIVTRQDEEKWRELFEEDIFWSLEEEENCRRKLLAFLMDHYKLPTKVWKLLDKKLSIVKGAAKLRETFPADFVRYIVTKCERGEDVDFSQFEGAPDAPYDLFLQYYDKCWQAIMENQLKQAEEYIKNADGLHIYHPVMEICRANLYVRQEKQEEAIALLAELRKRFPGDAMVGYNTAEIMWKNNRKEAAAKIFEELKEENNSHYMSNVRLSQWYYEQGRFREAKKSAETVLSAGADEAFMELLVKINSEIEQELEKVYEGKEKDNWEAGLELGWCCLQDGKISRGIRLAEELKAKVPPDRETERKGLLTKLLFEQAEYEKAIELSKEWEKALEEKIEKDETEEEKEKDRDRIRQAHLIRMQSYRSLGFADKKMFPLAIAETEAMETGKSRDIGLLLEKAQIYMEMEEYEKSLELVNRLVEEYQIYAAYATALEVYRRQRNAAGVVQYSRLCIRYFPSYVRAYEHAAKVYLDLEYKEELRGILEEAEKNGVKSVLLDACRYQLEAGPALPENFDLDRELAEFRKEYAARVSKGDKEAYEKGLPLLNTYLYLFPGTYMLVERGIFHRAAHHYQEAKEDFEKALEEDPAQYYALRHLSLVYKYQEDYEKALFCIKKAILYGNGEMTPLIYGDMGILYSLLGDNERAIEAFSQYVSLSETRSSYYIANMAACLAEAGRLQEAEALIAKTYPGDQNMLVRMEAIAELYESASLKDQSRRLLEAWESLMKRMLPLGDALLMKLGITSLKGFLKSERRIRNSVKTGAGSFSQFSRRKAWHELMHGEKQEALQWFDAYAAAAGAAGDARDAWCDAAFAAILCSDEKRGRKYAAKLKGWLAKEKQSSDGEYYNQGKAHLQMEILADFYTGNPEKIKELLDSEKTTEACQSCACSICKEIEAVRILYLFRIGREEEAGRRLRENIKKQPRDEYMAAIRHIKQECEK